jgi:hypothetical protein
MLSREELEEIRQRAFASKSPYVLPPETIFTEETKKRFQEQMAKDADEARKWREAGHKYILKSSEVQSYTKEQLGRTEDYQPAQAPLQTTIEWNYDKVNAPNVVRFIKHHNKRRGFELNLPFVAYLKTAKKLIMEYGEETVKDALITAAKAAKDNEGKNSYLTLKYVEGILARQLKESVK